MSALKPTQKFNTHQAMRYSLDTIAIAVLYFITGYLGLFFATSSGYATGFWIPSGIALGAVLVWGLRMLPGIFLGSLVINFYITSQAGENASLFLPVVTGLITACGAVLQAFVGCHFIKKWIDLRNCLNSPNDVLLFAFLSGPFSCLVNATWSNALLFALNIIPLSNLILSWETWWVGDSVGVLIFTPIFMIFFAEPYAVWKQRIVPIFLPLCFSFMVVILTFVVVSAAEVRRVQYIFSRTVDQDLIVQIENQLLTSKNITESLATYLSVIKKINPADLNNYGRQLSQQYHPIKSITWIPELKSKTEKEMVLWENDLLKIKENTPSVVFTFPVYQNNFLLGNVSALFIFDDLIKEDILKNDYYSLSILSMSGSENFKQVYSFTNTAAKPTGGRYKLNYDKNISIDHVTWLVKTDASLNYLNSKLSWQMWMVLVSGLLFCVLINIILFIIHGQKSIAQIIIKEKTSALEIEEKKSSLVLRSSEEGIYGVDHHGNTTFINPAAAMMLGYEVEELINRPIHFIIHHTYPNGSSYPFEACPVYAAIINTQSTHKSSQIFWRKDGTYFWVEYTCTPLESVGETKGAVVVFNEILPPPWSKREKSHNS